MHQPALTGGLHRAGVAAAAALAVAAAGAGVADAAGPVQLRSRLGSNWCLDAPHGAGAQTMVNPCDASASQRWMLNPGGQIENAAFPGTCLSLGDAADRSPVMLARCQAGSVGQRWTQQPDGKMTSALGSCLNIFGGVAQPGTPVIGYHDIPGVEDEQWDALG